MGVIVKYLVAFPGVGLKVSNDAFAGDLLLDVDVRADMKRGAVGGSFDVTIYDLPGTKGKEIRDLRGTPLGSVVVMLGYMDGAFDVVMNGVLADVVETVQGDRRVTVFKGAEAGTHALRASGPSYASLTGGLTVKAAVAKLLDVATLPAGEIEKEAVVQDLDAKTVRDKTFRGRTVLEMLDDVARDADAEMLVTDKRVYIGQPVRIDSYQLADPFDRGVNLASFEPFSKLLPNGTAANRLEELPAETALGYDFVIAGDPKLRPGHRVFTNEEEYEKKDGEYRVLNLTHTLSTTAGYICTGRAVRVTPGDPCRNQQDRMATACPDKIVQGLTQRMADEQQRRPALEVGSVKEYQPGAAAEAKHRGTLYFGQRFPGTETQPSIRAAVETEAQQVARNKPIVSPFAWRKCGLVAPVYPGMKAVLGHNLNLPDDAMVMGYLWSEQPAFDPPPSKDGDWWLSLPVDFDPTSPPADGTKAANDLTSNAGNRVIEVKGLKITVGTDKLGAVGTRPTEGGDDEFLIEHKKARIKITADGTIEMTADAEGGVVLKISKSGVEIA